ncbi:MAG: response regulator [Thermoanaerobaculales bacterium]|jgi:DNA-binding NarL/FixJ family response regulator|nr:response regulator [Thermoanaerobaculales bacterium]
MPSLRSAKGVKGSVLVGIRHAGLAEGVRDLLAQNFDPVVVAPDEDRLLEDASRLHALLAVVDLELGAGDGLNMLRRLRAAVPEVKVIVLTPYDSPSIEQTVLAAGADRLIPTSAVAFGLVPGARAVLGEPLDGDD